MLSFKVFSQFGTSHEVINYSPKEYHAHNQNWQAVQDDRGVMYFANGDGILEFDGTFWKHIPTATITSVLSLGINTDGKIFYGGIGEMGYLEPDENGNYVAIEILPESHKEEFASEFFWNIHIFGEKAVFRSEKYYVIVTGDDVAVFEPPHGKTKRSFATDTEIWLQDESKNIYWFDFHQPDVYHPFQDSLLNQQILQGVYNLEEGKKMFVAQESGIYIHNTIDKSTNKTGNQTTDFSRLHVSSSLYLPNGDLVLCTSNSGVIVLDQHGKIAFHYFEGNGLNTNSIRSSFLDREGILWFTSDEGISKAMYNIPYTVLQEEGSELKGISNAIIKHNNKVYVATSEGVFVMNEINPMDLNSGLAKKVKNLDWQSFDLVSVADELFCATPGGLFIIDSDSATALSDVYSRAICVPEGRIDQLIVGGRDKVLFYEKQQNKWILKDTITDFPDEILHIEQDKSEKNQLTFWAGLYSVGVAKIECSNEFTNIKYKQLGPKNGIEDGYILPFQINNKMYFSPKPGGIYCFNDKDSLFEYDDLITPVFGKDVSSWLLKEDYYQNILFENSGPVHILRKKNNSYLVDSLALSTLNLGYINDIYVDNSSICWFAGESGIARFNSTIDQNIKFDYNVLVKKITINRDSVLFQGNFFQNKKAVFEQQGEIPQLPYNLNSISFEFSSPYHNGSNKLEYSYILVGYDNNFSTWNKENKAVYTNLHEGNYTFKVKAKNIYGLESSVSEYNFSISPPWYRTLWAYLLYALSGISFISLIVIIISFRLRRANEKLQKIVKEKTQEIVSQRDVLAEQKEQLEERNKEIIDSIAYAKRLQDAILPSQEEIDNNLPDSFIFFQPKDIVAGDFYWMDASTSLSAGTAISASKERHILFAAADCTGHGVPGAMVSVVCSNALNRAIKEYGITDPGKILDKVTELVTQTFARGKARSGNFGQDVKDGMDIALCSLEFLVPGSMVLNSSGSENISSKEMEELKNQNSEPRTIAPQTVAKLRYAGAHNPLWLIRPVTSSFNEEGAQESESEFELIEIKADKQPVGWHEKRVNFTTHSMELYKNDMIYLFSDGFADQFGGPRGKKYKYKKFKDLLLSICELPMEKQLSLLNKEFIEWRGENEQIDDVCVIGVRV